MIRFFSSIPKIAEQSAVKIIEFVEFANVKRMDIHGNTFSVAEKIPVEKAQKIAEEFEARGHHQTYWVEKLAHENPITAQPSF